MPSALVWFRRDLRHFDHAALSAACAAHSAVYCAFVFDTDIIAALPRDDRRISFIHAALAELDAALSAHSGGLIVLYGRAVEEIPRLAARLAVDEVHAARDYEPAALQRDAHVARALAESGRRLCLHKDQVLFETDEIVTGANRPYAVYTPYRNAWRARLQRSGPPAALQPRLDRLRPPPEGRLPPLAAIGFRAVECGLPTGMSGGARLLDTFLARIDRYAEWRDFPALAATSRLSAHLRFGTVSIRALVREAWMLPGEGAHKWLDELIWREFYQMILWARPDVVDRCFKRAGDALRWEDDEAAFLAWRTGRTGYPLVDAAMRELAATGWMHNRLRMVCASFLCKHLGIDWRRGEAYFASTLLDYDLAANNGGWQWCASTGCDAQPYFRIFNPVSQSEKFDPRGEYLIRWLPELALLPPPARHAPWRLAPVDAEAYGFRLGRDYPAPIIDHGEARQRTLARFALLADERDA